ncbi:MAG: ribonuclease P protein component [Selenomonadaceae bacterium]|nr:ribonuclease P protein component [Selenomonadaceae bacterium]
MFQLSKEEILRDNREFNEVYSKGKSYVNKNLVIHVLHDERYNGKVGFAAGKKLGSAVVRNRVKRLLRETYRLCKKNLRSDCALVILGRKNLVDAKVDAAIESFIEICKKAKLFKD